MSLCNVYPTRPAEADEQVVTVPQSPLRPPRVPADLAAMVVAMLEARRDFRLEQRGQER